MHRLVSGLIERVTGFFAPRRSISAPRQTLHEPPPAPPLPEQPIPQLVKQAASPSPAAPAHRDRIAMQREAVRMVRQKLDTFVASLDGLEDDALINAIHHFERYGYSKVSGVPRIDIPLRRDQYDHEHLQEMKAFIEAKCAILLRICDREELQLEIRHPSNLIGANLDELKPATPEQLKEIVSDLTKEIDHMTRMLVKNMDPRLYG